MSGKSFESIPWQDKLKTYKPKNIMKKITPVLISLFLLLNYSLKSQTVQFGKISDDPKEKNYGVLGVVGNSYYTLSANVEGKGSVCFIHKCSSETMEIQETKKIELGGLDMLKKSWSVLKVDKKLVLIIADWSRETSNKIYGEVLVNADGSVNTWDKMNIIGDWENPVVDGKPIIMGTNILIIGSSEIEGLPTNNNKILVYYQKNKDYSMKDWDYKTDMLSFVLFDKDLKQIDKQSTNFDNIQVPFHDPIMDVSGNFYMLPRTNPYSGSINESFGYFYDYSNKKLVKQPLAFTFKNNETAKSILKWKINDKGNLVYSGLYRDSNKTGSGSGALGLFINELNIKGNVKFDYLLLNDQVFDQTHPLKNKKAADVMAGMVIYITNNYFLISKESNAVDKNGVVLGSESHDFVILKINEEGKLKKINSYSSDIYYSLGDKKIRPTKYETVSIDPIFLETKDKLYMMFSLWNYEFKPMNLKGAGDRICALNTFDLKGGLQTTFLYDIDSKTNHPVPINSNRLNSTDCLISSDFIRSGVSKISFK